MKTLKTDFTSNSNLYVPCHDVIRNGKAGQLFDVYTIQGNTRIYQCTVFCKAPVTRNKVLNSHY